MVGFYDLDFGEAPPGNYSGACFLILVWLFLGWNCIIMCVYVGVVFLFFYWVCMGFIALFVFFFLLLLLSSIVLVLVGSGVIEMGIRWGNEDGG